MAKKSERNIALGLEVKRLREELGITQKLLAERTKVDPAYISMIESGTRAFRMSGKNNFARDLSEVLGVHLSHWAKYTSDGQIAGIANVPLQQLEKLQLKFKMLGFAAAGRPKDPESHIERTISFGEFFKGDDVYVVEAVGDSMIESLIGDGDYVILRKCENPENNTIVVAYVRDPKTENGGLTIKRYKNHQLLPDNDKSDVPPLDVTSNVQILGNYIGVIRKDQPKKQRKATKKPKR